jgi:hypothetical protein
MSYWDAVRAAEESKRRFTSMYPPYLHIRDVVMGSEARGITGFAQLDPRERVELLEGVEELQLFCEEKGPALVPPAPWERAYVEAYMTAPRSLKGIGSYVRGFLRGAEPTDTDRLRRLLERMFRMVPRQEVAELMHAMETYLADLAREGAITPPWAKGGGGLMKLGYYSHMVASRYAAAPEEERADAFSQLLEWVAGVIWKQVERPVAELAAVETAITICREAVYAYPWLKLWLSQTLANSLCEDIGTGEARIITVVEALGEHLSVVGFLTMMALVAAELTCPAAVGGIGAVHAVAKICAYLATLRPEARYMDTALTCAADMIESKCRYAAEAYTAGRPYLARLRAVLEEDCRRILSHVFADPRALKDFVKRYAYGRSGFEVGDYYTDLSRETGVPRYRVVLAIRALRGAGEVPYPWFIERVLRGLG